jgi:hypothetical protein
MPEWSLDYLGHSIRVSDGSFGEKLTIDGVASQSRRPWFRSQVRGIISQGEGVGEEVVATIISGLFSQNCKVTIGGEPLAPRLIPELGWVVRVWIGTAVIAALFTSAIREADGILAIGFGLWLSISFVQAISSTVQYRRAVDAQRREEVASQ